MGWKGTMRSLAAASRRAEAQQRRAARAKEREEAKVNKSVQRVMQKAKRLEEQLQKDPIKAISARYTETDGLQTQPFEIDTDILSGRLTFHDSSENDAPTFDPSTFKRETATVSPLDIWPMEFATLVAFRFENDDVEFRPKLNLVKKSDRQASRVCIVDSNNNEYYYPMSTDLSGEVIGGRPRVGLVAFEPFRRPTDKIEIHFSDVKLTGKRGTKDTFSFSMSDAGLPDAVARLIDLPSISDRVSDAIETALHEMAERKRKAGGCLGALGCGSVVAICLVAAVVAAVVVAL